MNNAVLPRVYGRAVRMPGFFVLLAVVLGTRFAGPWGAILAVPVAGFIYSLIFAWGELGQGENGEADEATAQHATTTSGNGTSVETAGTSGLPVVAGNGSIRVNGNGSRIRSPRRILASIRSMISR